MKTKELLEKIYLSNGNHPKETEWYQTDYGFVFYRNDFGGGWKEVEFSDDPNIHPEWYLKTYTPKKEIIEFVEWMDKSVLQMHSIHLKPWHYNGEGFTTEELYDKFKTL